MRLQEFLNTWDGHGAENRFSRLIILVLLATNVISGLTAFRTERSIILVPPTLNAEVQVTRSTASEEFKTSWGLYLAELMDNTTPATIDFIKQAIEPILSPDIYRTVLDALQEQVKAIKLDRITLSFSPRTVLFEKETNKVRKRSICRRSRPAPCGAQSASVGPQTLRVMPGVNELMPIAAIHLNRIVTPFDNPKVTTTSQATTQVKGRIVYVATADETPVTLYVTPGDNQDMALSLTLVPRKIPAREIHMELDPPHYKTLAKIQHQETGSTVKPADKEQEYIVNLKKIFRALALQKTPAGFSLREPAAREAISCTQAGLRTRTGQALEGQDMVILVGITHNNSTDAIEVDERSCAESRGDVLAVAVSPPDRPPTPTT